MSTPAFKPTQERLDILDILRGFALFGVLMVNLVDFSSDAFDPSYVKPDWNSLNLLADWGTKLLFEAKFYLLFGFLFGVGFAIQMKRAEAKGSHFTAFYLRRLAILLVIGLLHATLLWRGDILRLYAVFGVVLLAVRHLSIRTLLGGALVCYLLSFVMVGALPGLEEADAPLAVPSAVRYLESSYWQLVEHRATDPIETLWLIIQVPTVLAVFLVGLALGRSHILENLADYHALLRRWIGPALLVGLAGNLAYVWGWEAKSYWLSSLGIHLGAPALSLAYASAVILGAQSLRWLAPVGQMALTNYISHSLICTSLFYGYGLGLYNQVSPLERIGLAVVIFSGQILLSHAWMHYFRFGPLEWVWRSLTYGERQAWWRTRPTASSAGLPSPAPQ